MGIITDCITGALDSGSGSGAGFKCSASLPHLLEMCRVSFLCAGRATEDALRWWKSVFRQLTVRLAESLQSISYTEEDVYTKMEALIWHFKIIMGEVDMPKGEVYGCCNNPPANLSPSSDPILPIKDDFLLDIYHNAKLQPT